MCIGVELINDELVLLDARPLAELSFSAVGSCRHHHCLADLASDQDLQDTSNGGATQHNTQQSNTVLDRHELQAPVRQSILLYTVQQEQADQS